MFFHLDLFVFISTCTIMHNFQYREVADNKVLFALILSAANKLSTADKVNSIINYPKGKGFIFNNVILITGTYHLGLF